MPSNLPFKKKLNLTAIDIDITAWQSLPLSGNSVAIWVLGQAGFAIRYGSDLYLIDPYLSDSLARKYRGKKFPHQRIMPIPVDPAELNGVNWVLCTHRHSDHMDPDTLLHISRHHDCHFLVPCSLLEHAVTNVGLAAGNSVCINAGQSMMLGEKVTVQAIPSAHETLKVNSKGEHYFLGYIVTLGNIRIYHSGDCVPYKAIEGHLRQLRPDIALLPVNGRDAYRLNRNIPGNFHFEEAVQLCLCAHITYMIPHHFGMFDFNTIRIADLREKIKTTNPAVRPVMPRVHEALVFNASG